MRLLKMKNKKLNFIIPFIYLFICLIICFSRVPFWDEARAWLIAQNCNIVEFLDMMKLECHLAPWFIVIFPFAKLNLFYPYSIYVINALFAYSAIRILWNYSPFNLSEKALITFSVPFLFLWGTVARCYAIGIFLLFLALKYYKIRFQKPVLYITLITLSMNTSVMAFIGGWFLGLIFIFENLKKKKLFKILSVFLAGIFIVIFQIYTPNPDFLKQEPAMTFFRDFIGYLFNPVVYISQYKIQSILMSILRICVLYMTFAFTYFSFKNNKKILFFISSAFLSMIILFSNFYSGNFWHYFYFYLYFIVSVWILKTEHKTPQYFNIGFILILVCFMFKGSLFIDSKLTTVNSSTSKYIAEAILSDEDYKNKTLFCLDPWSDIAPSSLPYLKNKIIIYDKNKNDRTSYKSMRNQVKFNYELFNPDEFYQYVDNNSILLTTRAFINHEKNNPLRSFDDKTKITTFKGKKAEIKLILYKNHDDIHLWSYLIKVNIL